MYSMIGWDECIGIATIDVLQSAVEKRVEGWEDRGRFLKDSCASEPVKYFNPSKIVLRGKIILTAGVMVRMQNFFRSPSQRGEFLHDQTLVLSVAPAGFGGLLPGPPELPQRGDIPEAPRSEQWDCLYYRALKYVLLWVSVVVQ